MTIKFLTRSTLTLIIASALARPLPAAESIDRPTANKLLKSTETLRDDVRELKREISLLRQLLESRTAKSNDERRQESTAPSSAAVEIPAVNLNNPGHGAVATVPLGQDAEQPVLDAFVENDKPTEQEIWKSFSDRTPGIVHLVVEVKRRNFSIRAEPVNLKLESSRFYPLVGVAHLLNSLYKCTVDYDQTIHCDWPVPSPTQSIATKLS